MIHGVDGLFIIQNRTVTAPLGNLLSRSLAGRLYGGLCRDKVRNVFSHPKSTCQLDLAVELAARQDAAPTHQVRANSV